jgi:hypothetical protein
LGRWRIKTPSARSPGPILRRLDPEILHGQLLGIRPDDVVHNRAFLHPGCTCGGFDRMARHVHYGKQMKTKIEEQG